MGEIKRTLKTMPNFKTNSPHDFFHFNYSLSYFFPETQEKIEDAVNGLYARIEKILDDDRKKAEHLESGIATGRGQLCQVQD